MHQRHNNLLFWNFSLDIYTNRHQDIWYLRSIYSHKGMYLQHHKISQKFDSWLIPSEQTHRLNWIESFYASYVYVGTIWLYFCINYIVVFFCPWHSYTGLHLNCFFSSLQLTTTHALDPCEQPCSAVVRFVLNRLQLAHEIDKCSGIHSEVCLEYRTGAPHPKFHRRCHMSHCHINFYDAHTARARDSCACDQNAICSPFNWNNAQLRYH